LCGRLRRNKRHSEADDDTGPKGTHRDYLRSQSGVEEEGTVYRSWRDWSGASWHCLTNESKICAGNFQSLDSLGIQQSRRLREVRRVLSRLLIQVRLSESADEHQRVPLRARPIGRARASTGTSLLTL
jgi:hypothetical protein